MTPEAILETSSVYPQFRILLLDDREVMLYSSILAYLLFIWSTDGSVWTLNKCLHCKK